MLIKAAGEANSISTPLGKSGTTEVSLQYASYYTLILLMIRGLHCSLPLLPFCPLWLPALIYPPNPTSPPPVGRTVFNVEEAKHAVSRDVDFPYPPIWC